MSSNFNHSQSKQHVMDEKTELQTIPTSAPSVPSKTAAMPAMPTTTAVSTTTTMPAMPTMPAATAVPRASISYVVPQETLTINPSRTYQEVSITNEVAKSCTSCSVF